jgi:UDP-GlcNAc:undecaprenyl-phosphate GlcNAc-1-phosphate transferase
VYSTLGLLGEYFQVPEYIMFYTIVACFLFHTYAMTHSFKMAKIVRKWKKLEEKPSEEAAVL